MADAGDGDGDELVQPSFNDRLTIIDFPAVISGAGHAGNVAGASPAAVSLHTPTPPDVEDTETPFSFELVTSSLSDYELHRSPTSTIYSQYYSNPDYSLVLSHIRMRSSYAKHDVFIAVFLTVYLRYCAETAKYIIKIFIARYRSS